MQHIVPVQCFPAPVQEPEDPVAHADATTQQSVPVQCSFVSEPPQALDVPLVQIDASTQHSVPVQCSFVSEPPQTHVG
ncbi:hypothetical protein BE21_55000 [Sorangium cellulosum]|uniref:Uncharacterized protein n=1 Tax=Sorangium cellulosum TaxID=56 RepID=A0A150TCL9_SORCE|nr:hypothetical protein BE21_55000 [Sorangium cellulosum]